MPTYEYACKACDHRFEEFQSMSAAALKKCPACKKAKLERLIGIGAGVIFKGSGFYQTDYRSDGYKSDAKKDTESGGSDKSDAGKKGGCAPACGTSDAPTGCQMPKTQTPKSQTPKSQTSKKSDD